MTHEHTDEPKHEEKHSRKINLVYAGLLLHSAGKHINEENLKKVVDATGGKAEESQIKALVAALEGVNIDEVIEKAAMPVATSAPVAAAPVAEAAKQEESAEDKEKKAEEAAEGLGALFG
jgi:large subunit ribosomal protein L12